MKNFSFTAVVLLLSMAFLLFLANAQAPQKMSYQSVIRNSSNVLLVNTAVGMQLIVLQCTASSKVSVVHNTSTTTII